MEACQVVSGVGVIFIRQRPAAGLVEADGVVHPATEQLTAPSWNRGDLHDRFAQAFPPDKIQETCGGIRDASCGRARTLTVSGSVAFSPRCLTAPPPGCTSGTRRTNGATQTVWSIRTGSGRLASRSEESSGTCPCVRGAAVCFRSTSTPVVATTELTRLLHSVNQGVPFGAEAWTAATGAALGLESSCRPRRPPQEEGGNVPLPSSAGSRQRPAVAVRPVGRIIRD